MNFVKPLYEKLTNLIPRQIKPVWVKSKTDFSRNCKLPFGKLVVLILSLSASGKSKGVDIKAGEFFKNTRRSDLWIEAGGIHCYVRAFEYFRGVRKHPEQGYRSCMGVNWQ